MMLFTLLRVYLIWFGVSVIVCAVGVVLTLLYDDTQVGIFLTSYIYHWNGLLVAMSGYGALHFIMCTQRQQFHNLTMGILNLEDDLRFEISLKLEKLYSFKNKHGFAIPVFIVGMAILYLCGYPMDGFPKYYLWITSSSMFYVGGLFLGYGVHSIQLFHVLDENSEHVSLQDNVNIIELDNFHFYISILVLSGIGALYFAFRGTLTANFEFEPPHRWIDFIVNLLLPPESGYSSIKNLLLYPIVLFLPLVLFASFYIKFVLRKIYLTSIKRKIDEIDLLAYPVIYGPDAETSSMKAIETRQVILDLKDKIIQHNKILPIITLKDTPSIALIIIVIIQFILSNDSVIREYIGNIEANEYQISEHGY